METGTFKNAWGKYWLTYICVIIFAILLFYKGKICCEEHMLKVGNSHVHQYELSNLCAYENQFESRIVCGFYSMNYEYDQCKTYADKRDFHKKNAERCLNDARNMCWYLPSATRDKSFYAFTNLAILGSPGDPKSKLMTALITTLIQYGADVIDEWCDINTKLNWAKYHYEQYEFLSEVVKAGNP